MNKWMLAILALMLLAPAISAGCNSTSGSNTGPTDEAHGNQADPNYEVVFAQDKVNRIDIVIDIEHWQAMIDDMTENYGEFGALRSGGKTGFPGEQNFSVNIPDNESIQGRNVPDDGTNNPIWSECSIAFNNATWEHVGIRFKGFSSLSSSWKTGSWKLPLRLDFDQFEDDYPEINDQRFYGFKKLSLSSGYLDDSFIREKVTADLFRAAGVPAPVTAFYEVYVNYGEGPVYFGLYTMVEIPDKPMLDTQFGNDTGNLYKPSTIGAAFHEGGFRENSFPKQTNKNESDWSDITAMFEALHADTRTTNPAVWRSGLEAVFDVEGFLRWLAVNTVLLNWDTYGYIAHNYYLYNDPGDGLLHWIPWDNNEALKSDPRALSLSLSEVGTKWPLISYLINDDHYHEIYLSFINEFASGVFSVDYANGLCQKAHNLIEPYVIGENGTQKGPSLQNNKGFDYSLAFIFNHIKKRDAAALAFLSEQNFESSAVVISEILYNPSPDQGDENREFVEICNTGTSAVDLSGYAFTEGINFTFPQGISIAAGEYIIVAGNAASYTDLSCQVFQWESGNLSNKGEAIQLTDAGGIQVDYVIYSDASPWPAAADGNGPSLEVIALRSTNALPTNWEAGNMTGGTPGEPNS